MIRRKFHTCRSLTLTSWRVFLASLLQIPLMGLLIRWADTCRTVRLCLGQSLQEALVAHPLTGGDSQLIREVERGFTLAVKYSPFRGTCLSRSILLKRILQKRGVTTNLCIGVRHPALQALPHAWLESKSGRLTVDGAVARHYDPMVRQHSQLAAVDG